jgi:hypothetical protein
MRRALLFILFLGLSIGSWAQDTASIIGTVKDSSGGVIVGAKVTVANPEKGFTRDLVSNSVGEYSAQAIPIGNYVITVEAQGFQKLERAGITVGVGQVLPVDLTMAVGQTTQEMTVTTTGAKGGADIVLIVLISIWAVITVAFAILLIYRRSITKNEADWIPMTDDAKEDSAIQKQTATEKREQKLTVPIRTLGWLSVVMFLVTLGYYLYHALTTSPPLQ